MKNDIVTYFCCSNCKKFEDDMIEIFEPKLEKNNWIKTVYKAKYFNDKFQQIYCKYCYQFKKLIE